MQDTLDAIVVGTGPGGAPLARDLARAGKRVLLLERGIRHERALGMPLGPRIMEGAGLFCRSEEGVFVARGITLGGSSMIYNANVFYPPQKVFDSMGVDFSQSVEEIRDEIGPKVLPDRFFKNARGLSRLLAAADSMGLYFEPQKKFVNPDKCRVGCDSCMAGCARNAKFTTRVFVDQAIAAGAKLIMSAAVDSVVVKNGRAIGLKTKDGREFFAKNIVLSAGGVGTPAILLRSGVSGVGTHFYMDPMNIVVGYMENHPGAKGEMSFTHAIESTAKTEKFIIGNISAFAVAATSLMRVNVLLHNIPRFPRYKYAIGLFVKLSDSAHGQVFADGKISKPFIPIDIKRMKAGTDLAKAILVRAGVAKSSLAVGEGIGGHPGGTVAMGRALDSDFRVKGVENLYVCDGSALPESPGVPPSLTIMGMSRHLGKKLITAMN